MFLIGCRFLLSSCGVITYIGDKYPPTDNVDVYYSAHDIKKPYKVIGQMSYSNDGTKLDKSAFIAYGKTMGADAIVITGTEATKDSQAPIATADAAKYGQ
jgi:hypothetical protein